MHTKRCTTCGLEKPLDGYYFVKKLQWHQSRCKRCTNAYTIARAAADPAKHNARSKAWRDANPEKWAKTTAAWRAANPEKVRRNAYQTRFRVDFEAAWTAQQGLCASCQLPMLDRGKEPNSVCVDHDRSCCPGMKSCGKCVRGLIHRNCNLVLGYAKDDLAVLRNAVAYLERWEARLVNP